MRNLPRTNASPAFTREVMRKARGNGEGVRRPLVWRMAAAFAMAACLLAAVQLGVMQHRQRERTIALRAEQQQLVADLDDVKKIAEKSEPVVVLENDQGTQVIMDLDSAIQPASHRNYD
jgi:Tfp pilus assembly protein PilN